jgi:hypothetical protein
MWSDGFTKKVRARNFMRKATSPKKVAHIAVSVTIIPAAKGIPAPDTFKFSRKSLIHNRCR